MILDIISTIFSSLGIYGFFSNNIVLLYLGMIFVILEHSIKICTKQEKSLTTVWFALLISFGMMAGGINWLKSIALCLCFEGTICFILGIILMIFVDKSINKAESKVNDSEQIINELKIKSGLPKHICTDIYEILSCFLYNNPTLAYEKIEKDLIPHLEEVNDIGSVGVAFGMLVNENALSKEESIKYSSKVIETLIKKEQSFSVNKD